jgi:hypothetical protein
MRAYLLDNLRIDPERLEKLNTDMLSLIADRYRSRKIRLLSDLLRKLSGGKDNE